jgi:hypothetical protein
MIHNADYPRYCVAGRCRIILLYSIEYCIIPLPVDLLAHPALGQHWKEIILHFLANGKCSYRGREGDAPCIFVCIDGIQYTVWEYSYKVY